MDCIFCKIRDGQIPSIRVIKDALQEGSRIFVELHSLGAPMKYIDVGGGLAVDYDGSNTNFHSSMNYSVQEYANDVVAAISAACDARGVPKPTIVTESGRAMVAHHAMLVFDILDTNEVVQTDEPQAPGENDHDVVHELYEIWRSISRRNLREPYHDAIQCRDEASQLFNLGYLDLAGRPRAEGLFFSCCSKLSRVRLMMRCTAAAASIAPLSCASRRHSEGESCVFGSSRRAAISAASNTFIPKRCYV